jgi:hypothetical protein
MFEQGSHTIEHGMILFDEADIRVGTASGTETQAYLVQLEGSNAVFLGVGSRLSYVETNDSITTGPVDALEPGHRLIIINPDAREAIAHRILVARQGEETDQTVGQFIRRWQQELSEGMKRLGWTYGEVLRRIQGLGSQRADQAVIGQWARGDVLGPLDVRDIDRIGQVIGSDWLIENWQRVGAALLMIRSGHRVMGRQITRIIQKAAVADYVLAPQDEEFLRQIGITIGELQDAVTLLIVESVSREAQVVPIEQVGKVITL